MVLVQAPLGDAAGNRACLLSCVVVVGHGNISKLAPPPLHSECDTFQLPRSGTHGIRTPPHNLYIADTLVRIFVLDTKTLSLTQLLNLKELSSTGILLFELAVTPIIGEYLCRHSRGRGPRQRHHHRNRSGHGHRY